MLGKGGKLPRLNRQTGVALLHRRMNFAFKQIVGLLQRIFEAGCYTFGRSGSDLQPLILITPFCILKFTLLL